MQFCDNPHFRCVQIYSLVFVSYMITLFTCPQGVNTPNSSSLMLTAVTDCAACWLVVFVLGKRRISLLDG